MGRIHNLRLCDGSAVALTVDRGRIVAIDPMPQSSRADLAKLESDLSEDGDWDGEGCMVLPAMVDMHVHSRNPGYAHKETWDTLARGAFRGGVLGIADMPNTNPPTLFADDVREKVAAGEQHGIRTKVFLGVTEKNVDSLASIIKEVRPHLAGLKIYYGKSTGGLIFDDLERLRKGLSGSNILLVFHSEDQCCIDATVANYGPEFDSREFADFVVHSRVRSKEAAITSTRVLLKWAESVDCPFHLAHVSTPEEVELLQEAKARGLQISSEVAPHHLLLCEDDYPRLGPYIKVNPPVRTRADVEKMRSYFKSGYFDAFATDHAPHTRQEKLQPLGLSPSGIPSIEMFTPLLWQIGTELGIRAEELVAMGSSNPARLIGLEDIGRLEVGARANLVLLSNREYTIKTEDLICKSNWTPYEGMTVTYRVESTWNQGRSVYKDTKGSCE